MPSQRSYVPPQIQRQMEQALQRTLPSNLKQYASGNTYVPQHAQKAMQQQIDKMPAHLKEYGGEFVRQQSMSGAVATHTGTTQPAQHVPPPPINPMRRDHSLGFGQQHTVNVDNPSSLAHLGSLAYTSQYQGPASGEPVSTPVAAKPLPNTDTPPKPNYDFMAHYDHPESNNWLLTASLKTRILVVGGGALVLLLITWILIALLSASSGASLQNFVALAGEQAELARISDAPSRDASLETTQNLASTTRLSLLSDENLFVSHLQAVNATPTAEVLAIDRNPQTDAQLQAAQTNGTYDQTYTTIATGQLTTYAQNLKKAFNATGNASDRQLLNLAYENAQLLLKLSQQSS